MEQEKKIIKGKNGGWRPGAGRPRVPDAIRARMQPVSLRPRHMADAKAWGRGKISPGVQRAIEYVQRQIALSGLEVEEFFEDEFLEDG